MYLDQPHLRDRLGPAIAVAALHGLIGYALLTGPGLDVVRRASEPLIVVDVGQEVPPPPQAEKPARTSEPEGAAAPPNLKARPTKVVAPPPKLLLPVPPPVVAAPVAGPGSEASAGAADRPGPGSGAGGIGTGLGSGGLGSGTGGGGGVAVKARQIAGRISDSDYPRAAYRARAEGTVDARFTVSTAGRAEGCVVIRSSGNAELDATTCRLIERRYRFRPARDAEGRPVPEVRIWRQYWWLEPPKGADAPPPWVQIPANPEDGVNPRS